MVGKQSSLRTPHCANGNRGVPEHVEVGDVLRSLPEDASGLCTYLPFVGTLKTQSVIRVVLRREVRSSASE